jgi:hypothetical protein
VKFRITLIVRQRKISLRISFKIIINYLKQRAYPFKNLWDLFKKLSVKANNPSNHLRNSSLQMIN